jgi:hypothetical protein
MSACPHCGATRRREGDYCLDCGRPLRIPTRAQAFRTRVSSSSVWPLVSVLVLAAAGALVAIAVSRGDDGEATLVATNLPARTTQPRLPVFGTETIATTLPPIVTTAPPATTGPRRTALTEWTLPGGYTLVLASIPQVNGRASAVQIARRALTQGLSDVGVLDSRDFAELQPGYFVVFSGVYTSNAEAAGNIAAARSAGFAAAYARRVTR